MHSCPSQADGGDDSLSFENPSPDQRFEVAIMSSEFIKLFKDPTGYNAPEQGTDMKVWMAAHQGKGANEGF